MDRLGKKADKIESSDWQKTSFTRFFIFEAELLSQPLVPRVTAMVLP